MYSERIQKKLDPEIVIEECEMNTSIVIVRVLFCSNVIGAKAFTCMDEARKWARKFTEMGRIEKDGPQFEVEYSM